MANRAAEKRPASGPSRSWPTHGSNWAISKTTRGDCGRARTIQGTRSPISKTSKSADSQKHGQSEAELQQLRRADRRGPAAGRRRLRKDAADRPRSYAVVPYEGPNQTRRRPIYLECRADAVVMQPEGIRLTEADFEGPMGPGNPLAAALRAAREHLLAERQFDPQAGEPYPLLLVRPEGIGAYYAAREAMKSWGCDFGYELIGDDWKLAYPPRSAVGRGCAPRRSARHESTRRG